MSKQFRSEHDLIGDRDVPQEAYWGIHTLRALENFPITGKQIGAFPMFVKSLALIKKAAALANCDLGELKSDRCDAIVKACDEIIAGKLHDAFVVDVIQGGAGTSTNMNANEVIANRGLEIMGHKKGEYQYLHPMNDVNCSQSTNDVYPTAIRLAVVFAVQGLLESMKELRDAFAGKAVEFSDVLKLGRTQLQDAVPMTLGQEFETYAVMLGEDKERLREATRLMYDINMGATAIGTGINTNPDYAPLISRHLSNLTGLPFKPASNLISATQDTGDFVQLSGVLKRAACKISKVCNDLRLLSSGPQTGLCEIKLPERAAGSSIMPGKVNPIIPEVVNQIAYDVIGNDLTITLASEGGQLQLNAFEPIIAYSLFKSISYLEAGCQTLSRNCVVGITANRELLHQRVMSAAGLATALNPYIGYEKSTLIAREALATGRSVSDLVIEHGFMDAASLGEILKPENLTKPVRIKPAKPAITQ